MAAQGAQPAPVPRAVPVILAALVANYRTKTAAGHREKEAAEAHIEATRAEVILERELHQAMTITEPRTFVMNAERGAALVVIVYPNNVDIREAELI